MEWRASNRPGFLMEGSGIGSIVYFVAYNHEAQENQRWQVWERYVSEGATFYFRSYATLALAQQGVERYAAASWAMYLAELQQAPTPASKNGK